MADSIKTARGDDQYMLRLPAGMRDEIKASADANGRSMNAEIVARLNSHHSLRDQFAGQALAGLYACRDLQLATLHDMAKTGSGDFDACMAKQAYLQADAMIAARKAGA
ncbi:Arc family DNA-binding protein [Agrobacterium tumefaciens]|uniref:Arc family DNA-binding protein n=1 Tax=Agrobacterium tumefaciens TaxID=358 RepID=UPI000CF03C55|nr:Arc family DNA-binding protein [Agrobacterium tumefaciens]NSY95784.1 Arc family DNA-binding protein [Agrobacterium tumefaciens]